MAQLLFNHGATANVPDSDGNTSLHVAVESGSNELCLRLLRNLAGVNIETRNKFGQTHLLYAVHLGNLPASCLLLEHHADMSAVTNEGHTVLHLAYIRYCQNTILRLRASMTQIVAQIREREAWKVLTETVKVLGDYGADENAVEYIMGFNPKSYFAWLLETLEGEGSKGIRIP